MKKYLTLLILTFCALALTACGGGAPEKKAAVPVKGRALVVYYSRADENSGVGHIEKGNTKILAEFIAKATGADMFEIVPAKPYPKQYKAATEVAKKEKEENARPEIVGTMPDVSKYDVIFFGYPIWWHDLPMVCYTFFDKVKLEGKTVAPFCTHEGSGLSDTDRFIAKTTGATVTEAFEMYGTKAQNWKDEAKQETLAWLKKIGYEK